MNPTVQNKIREIWGATLASAETDPALTIHELPAATSNDVDELYRTLKATITPYSRSLPDDNETIETLVTPKVAQTGRIALPGEIARSEDDLIGQDCYSVGKLLGSGGMGMVFAARQDSLNRDVAVKTMRKSSDSTHMAAFLREALTTAALAHPNIVPVYYFGRDSMDRLFMVMKRVEGRAWSDLLHPPEPPGPSTGTAIRPNPNDQPLSAHLEIFLKVCDAITFAHARKVVHRDLKPDNIMVGDFGEVMVMDWGLALNISDTDSGLGHSRAKASVVAGTPAYMAPEMAQGDLAQIAPQTDVYLLGAILYEVVTGRPPHFGVNLYETLVHAAGGKYEPIKAREGLPKGIGELERIIKKCLEPNAKDRYETVAALQADVRGFQAGQSDRTGSETLAKEGREALQGLTKEVELISVTSPYYPKCAEILAKAQQALALWGFNPRAVRLRQETLALYADLAVRGRDWGLAESLLRDLKLSGSGGATLAHPLDGRLRVERENWKGRDFLLRRTARVALLAMFVSVGLAGFFYMKWQQAQTELQRAQLQTPPAPIVAQASEKEPPVNPATATQPVVTTTPALTTQAPPVKPIARPTAQSNPPSPTLPPRLAPPNAIASQIPPAKPPEFAPQAQPPRWLPLDPSASNQPAAAGNAALLRGVRANAAGRLVFWDDAGRGWVWSGRENDLPERPWFEALGGQRLTNLYWADNNNVLFSDNKGNIYLAPPVRGNFRPVFQVKNGIEGLAVQRKGADWLIATADDNILLLMKSSAAQPVRERCFDRLRCMSFLTDGRLQMIYANGIEFRAIDGGGKTEHFRLEAAPRLVAPAADALILALVPENNPRQIIAVNTSQQGPTPACMMPLGEITAIACAADGKFMLAGSSAGELAFCSTSEKDVYTYGKAHTGRVVAVEIAPDGSRAYSIDETGGIFTWDVSAKKR